MIASQWKKAFVRTVQHHDNIHLLREAAMDEQLSDWTAYLTHAVVSSCESLGWQAAAIGHELDILPIPHSEYLKLDVMAFAPQSSAWRFPVAVFELENSPNEDRIAYSLWKVLCVMAEMRIVFCYRRLPEQGPALVRMLNREVIRALPIERRMNLLGETLVVVGSRNDSATFPFGFFKWWRLDKNTGTFNVI
ncbi:MAG: hypothetical protein JW999_06130 [Methanotrichaceae archaeon]|nr:hypothetical protein [Methanotrichaceae archaeon]